MKTNINPELWNTLTEVQKRALAENIFVEKQGFFSDRDEVAAWVSTLGGVAVVITFAAMLLR